MAVAFVLIILLLTGLMHLLLESIWDIVGRVVAVTTTAEAAILTGTLTAIPIATVTIVVAEATTAIRTGTRTVVIAGTGENVAARLPPVVVAIRQVIAGEDPTQEAP